MPKSIMSKFLPNEDEILVVEVEKERAIYDSSLEKHKDYGYLSKCWNNISAVVGKSSEDCKYRWRNIRDTYMRHKKKLGTGSPAILSKKKWPLAGHLSFLDNVEYERITVWNVCNDQDSTIVESSQDNSGDPLNESTEETTEEVIHGKRSRAKHEQLAYVKRMNDYRTAIINSIQAQNEAILGRESTTDEIDLFFKSIAISVKKLPPRGKSEAKLSILSLVAQLEDKYLDNTGAQPTQPMFQTSTQPMFQAPIQPMFQTPTQPMFRTPTEPMFRPPYRSTDYNNIMSLSSTPSPSLSPASATSQGFDPYMNNNQQ